MFFHTKTAEINNFQNHQNNLENKIHPITYILNGKSFAAFLTSLNTCWASKQEFSSAFYVTSSSTLIQCSSKNLLSEWKFLKVEQIEQLW